MCVERERAGGESAGHGVHCAGERVESRASVCGALLHKYGASGAWVRKWVSFSRSLCALRGERSSVYVRERGEV